MTLCTGSAGSSLIVVCATTDPQPLPNSVLSAECDLLLHLNFQRRLPRLHITSILLCILQ
jgi:hypothetical protein